MDPAAPHPPRELRGRSAVDYAALQSGGAEGSGAGAGASGSGAPAPGAAILKGGAAARGPGWSYRRLYRAVMSPNGYSSYAAARVAPEVVTAQWARGGGLRSPVIVPASPDAAARLGMSLPRGGPLTSTLISEAVGPDTPVRTIDVASQGEGPRWKMRQWASYMDERGATRARLLNVVSLSLAGTRLEGEVVPPAAVRGTDLVERVWPSEVTQ